MREIKSHRGEEHPSHWKIFDKYKDGSVPEEFGIMGIAYSYMPNIPNEVVVWTQGQKIAMTRKRYNEKKAANKQNLI